MKQQAKEEIHKYITERVPFEYKKTLAGLEGIIKSMSVPLYVNQIPLGPFFDSRMVQTLSVGIDNSSNDSADKANEKITEGNDENLTKTDTYVIDSTTENKAVQPEPSNNVSHVSHVSQVSQTPEMSTNRYQEEGTDYKTMGLNDKDNGKCDLRNQEGADKFRAKVERLNKLADKGSRLLYHKLN